MTKDHYLPRLIIRNFTDVSGKIYFYYKKENKVYGPFDHRNQLQENNFYSKKSIDELQREFSHININPLFKRLDLDLDKNINYFLENPLSKIFSRLIKEALSSSLLYISEEESQLIKEYFVIQHLRTPAFKRISEEFRKTPLKLPSNTKDIVMNLVREHNVNFKPIVKDNYPNLNSKQRRAKVKEAEKNLKKRLKQDPNFIKDIKNSEKTYETLEHEIKKAEEELGKIRTHPDKHSSEILDNNIRERFLKKYSFDKRKIKLLVNKTNIPFILSDTGISIICFDYGFKQELHFYLPVHPQVLLEFSNDPLLEEVNEEFVKEFNQICKEECLLNVYSFSSEALKILN